MAPLAGKAHVLEDIQDATPSWSGYNHQGKVALYLVLRTLNKCYQNGLTATNYVLEIESLEDIAILNGTTYESLHQVKAYKTQTLSSYQDAIWVLLNKSAKYSPTEAVYLHTVKDITKPTKEKVRQLGASDNVQPIRDAVMKDFDRLYPKFQLYGYDGINYCAIDQIDNKIDVQVTHFLEHKGLSGYDAAKKRLFLLDIINDHVMHRHAARHDVTKHMRNQSSPMGGTGIRFSVFENSLIADQDEPNEFYLLCRLKDWFAHICDEYFNQEEENGESDLENMVSGAALISSLSNEDFRTFCRKVNPHVAWTNLDLMTFKELFEKTSTHSSLLRAFHKVEKKIDSDQFTYASNGKFYLPTTIHEGPYSPSYERKRRSTAREILSNVALDEILMEVQTFISSHMEMTTLQEIAENAVEAPPSASHARNRITRLGSINMITAEQAIKEIR